MSYKFTLSMNISYLQAVQTKFNTPPAVQLSELEGMFHRVHDFTQSHANLNVCFSQEYHWAAQVFPISKDQHELMSNLPSEFNAWRVGLNLFQSANLSPALRHFVNDSCRLLEPLTSLLAAKFPDIKAGHRQSLDSYIKKLQSNYKHMGFDDEFIVELYEVWNDYKHRETVGLQSTPWGYEDGVVVKARVELPKLNIPTQKLNDLSIDDFGNTTTQKILEVAQFVIS